MAAPAILRRLAPAALCAVLLFWSLARPALWQDEAETALLGESVARQGLPLVHLDGRLITGEPSLAAHESNERGVWIWNTWLPYYLTAASFKLFGATTWAARAPFALAALIAFLLAGELFRALAPGAAELASWLLAVNVPWLLFMRQCRYYSIASLGVLAALTAYRALLARRRGAPWALGASLLFLFHGFFIMGALMMLAIAADAAGRKTERRAVALVLGAAALAAAPAALYFRVWSRPGNHLYSFAESLQFLRTFLLWLQAFALPVPLLIAAFARDTRLKIAAAAVYLAILAVLLGESAAAGPAALLLLAAFGVWAARQPAPEREISWRIVALCVIANLAAFSLTGAEPYGRYLAPLLPFASLAAAQAILKMSDRRWLQAALSAIFIGTNFFCVAPARALTALRDSAPADTVSGMMRWRLRATPLRSELALFARELWSGRPGYVEATAEAMRRDGKAGERFFSSSDNLSLMFYTDAEYLTPERFLVETPDWIIPSAWIEFDPISKGRMISLLSSGAYREIRLEAPMTLWQNNPDILYHAFSAPIGPRRLYRRVAGR